MQVSGLDRSEYRMCELWEGVSREKSTYLVVLAAVVQSWDTSCVHCVKVGI